MVKAGKRHENAKGPHAPAASTASGRAKCQRSEQNNGNCSNIRGHYVDSGVDEYYANTDNYRNPHEERVREVLRQVLDDFARRSGHVESSRQADGANAFFRVLDLCAGSGEVTAVLLDYESEKLVETVTAEATSKARAMNEARHTFDKAEESTTHRSFLRPFYIQACDPYTHHLYERRIFGSCGMEKLRKQGQASRVQRCLPLSFQDILQGKLALVTSSFGSGAESSVDNSRAAADLNNNFDLIVCSYALHLCPQDQLPMVALLLSDVAKFLLIVTPHKRPVLKPEWGWVRVTKHGDQKEARDAQASADEIIGNEQQKKTPTESQRRPFLLLFHCQRTMLAEQVARAKVEGQEQLRHMLMIHVRVRSLNAHGQTIHSVHSRNPVTRRRSQTKRSRAKTNSSTTAPAGERAGFCTGPPRFATVRKVGDEVETFTASERGYGRGHKR